MTNSPTEAEILAFLRAVECGEIKLAPVDNPQDINTGEVVYFASNRWSITVFIEDNGWHHIDGLSTADGRECSYHDKRGRSHIFETYRPSEQVAWIDYKIPSWRRYRCVKCGQDLLDEDLSRWPDFQCMECTVLWPLVLPAI